MKLKGWFLEITLKIIFDNSLFEKQSNIAKIYKQLPWKNSSLRN